LTHVDRSSENSTLVFIKANPVWKDTLVKMQNDEIVYPV